MQVLKHMIAAGVLLVGVTAFEEGQSVICVQTTGKNLENVKRNHTGVVVSTELDASGRICVNWDNVVSERFKNIFVDPSMIRVIEDAEMEQIVEFSPRMAGDKEAIRRQLGRIQPKFRYYTPNGARVRNRLEKEEARLARSSRKP